MAGEMRSPPDVGMGDDVPVILGMHGLELVDVEVYGDGRGTPMLVSKVTVVDDDGVLEKMGTPVNRLLEIL